MTNRETATNSKRERLNRTQLAKRLVVTAKSPVVEITMLLKVTVWLLVRVNVFGGLVVPTI